MVGFRNIAVHDYQALQLPILISIIETHLDEFLEYSHTLLLGDAFRQKGKHETRRRKGVLVSKSHEDYEME